MPPDISSPYISLDDAIAGLASLESFYRSQQDRRCVFLTVYGLMTRAMRARTQAGAFLDNPWTVRYTVAFADLYRTALHQYEEGDPSTPRAWRIAFDAAKSGKALIFQDLLLGMNGHINNDLALALNRIGIDPDRPKRYRDHTAVNQVLSDMVDEIENRLNTLYTPGLACIPNSPIRVDRAAANFSLPVARECAWAAAVGLANADLEAERALLRNAIDLQSGVLAKLILVPNLDPMLIQALHRLEDGTALLSVIGA